MKMNKTFLRSKLVFPLVILVGIVVTVAINKSAPPMVHQSAEEQATPVTYIAVKKFEVRPSIRGFGEVEPDVLLNTVAEVSGRITYINPNLRKGNLLPAGTEVLKIDQKDYLLALKQAEADLAKNEASLKELTLKVKNTAADLKLAEEKLKLGKVELNRIEKLMNKSSVSRSNYDNQRTVVLQLEQEVQNLKSQAESLPAQIDVQKAQLEISRANIETQKHNLERTSLVVPFQARVMDVAVEAGQFVNQGAQLYSAQTIDQVVVEAQFPLDQFQILAKGFRGITQDLREAFISGDSKALFASLGLSAKVYLSSEKGPVWDAKFERLTASLDPSSRTLGVVVSIEHPYRDVEPGKKPPLLKGMYTEVLLEGRENEFFVLPRDALHNNHLYVINDENRLERFEPDYQVQGSMILLPNSMEENMRVVTSDLFPAVPGMKLKPDLDQNRTAEIERWFEELAQ